MRATILQKEIKRVEGTLDDIRENTAPPWWRVIANGALYGSGVVVGTILTIASLGWILSIFGIIPGFGEIAIQLHHIMNSKL